MDITFGKVSSEHRVKSVRIQSYSGRHFSAFQQYTERYSVSLHIQSECGKTLTRITLKTNIFTLWKPMLRLLPLGFIFRSSRPEEFCKKDVLRILQNSQENTCARVSFLISCKPSAQVFSSEFCKIFKNTFLRGCFYIFNNGG